MNLTPASTTPGTAAENLRRMTATLGDYWKPVLEKEAKPGSQFQAKIAYQADQEDGTRDYVTRCFQSEISKGDLYVELINFEYELLNAKERQLFRLPYRSDWKETYKEVEIKPGLTTFVIPFKALELINTSPLSSMTPVMPKPTTSRFNPALTAVKPAAPAPAEDYFQEPAEDLANGDDHITRMTIRDKYAMMHHLPLSKHAWINQMIHEGRRMLGLPDLKL